MKKLSKYIFYEFSKLFSILILIVLILFHLVDYIEKSKIFMTNKVPLTIIAQWIFYKLFFTAYLLIPTIALISSALLIIRMNSKNEIIILRTSGFSIKKLVMIFLIIGTTLSITNFILGEVIVPYTEKKADMIFYTKVKKIPYKYSKMDKIWLQANNCLCKIDFFLPSEKALQGITILTFDKSGHIMKKEHIFLASYIDNNWLFLQVNRVSYNKKFPYKEFKYSETSSDFPFSINSLGFLRKKPQEMNFYELYNYLKIMSKKGYSDPSLSTGLIEKITLPLMSIIMIIIPIGLSIGNARRKNFMVDFIYSVIWGFIYWGTVIITHYFSSSGKILSIFTLLPFALFVIIGYYYINKIE